MITAQKIAIDTLSKEDIKALKLEHLVADAVARKDREGLNFLNSARNEMVDTKSGKAHRRLSSYRLEYLEKYCGYVNPSKVKKSPKEAKINALFAEAERLIAEE